MANKVMALSDIGSIIKDGQRIAVGGFAFHRHPMALVREIVRLGRKNLTLVGWNNGPDFDLLIGADAVTQVETSYVGMIMWGLARHFRNAVESGRIKAIEYTEATACDRFRAAAMGLSFLPARGLEGSDVLRTNHQLQTVTCPISGQTYAAVPAANCDVALLHAHYADEDGNVLYEQDRMYENEPDLLIAKSAPQVIVSVERIVSKDFVRKNPYMTRLPGLFVTGVVELPFGAHPCSNDLFYEVDEHHFNQYSDATRSAESFDAYLQKYVFGPEDHLDYLDTALTASRIVQLTRRVVGHG